MAKPVANACRQQHTEQDQLKRRLLDESDGAANDRSGFAPWSCDLSTNPGDIMDILAKHI